MSITPEEARAELERRKQGKHPIATPIVNASANFTGSFADNVDIGLRKLLNLPLPEAITPEFASDKRIKELVEENKPLTEKPGGGMGKFAAEYALASALAPGVGKAYGTGIEALKHGPRLLKTLARWGSGPFTRGALETAPVSAALAEPGERGERMLKEAPLGGVLSKTLSGITKLGTGMAEYTDDAKRLMQYARDNGENLFIPVGAGAKPGPVREAYRTVLPTLPGAKNRLRDQAEAGEEVVRSIMYNDTTPPNAPRLRNPGADPEDTNRKLRQYFKDGYDQALNSYEFTVPEEYFVNLRAQIDELVDPKTADEIVSQTRRMFARRSSIPTEEGQPIQVGGEVISNMKVLTSGRAGRTKEGNVAEAWGRVRDSVDDIVREQLSVQPTGRGAAELAQARANQENLNLYEDLNEKWGQFTVLRGATKRASATKGGKWEADDAIRSIKRGREYGEGPLQGPLTDVQQTFGQGVYDPTAGGRLTGYALMGMGGGIGGGLGLFGGGPVGAVAGTAAGLGLGASMGKFGAKPGVQKFLMGELDAQKRAAELLRRYPKAAHMFDAQIRALIPAEGEE